MTIFLFIIIAIYFIVGWANKDSNNAEILISLIGILLPIILMILITL